MEAAYVFRVRFRPDPDEVRVEPAEFDAVVEYPAPAPGEEGWMFFRDALWRGNANDEAHLRELASGWLGVPVVAASFSELRADEAYFEALRDAVGENLDAFNADDVTEALHKYLGSSIRVGAE